MRQRKFFFLISFTSFNLYLYYYYYPWIESNLSFSNNTTYIHLFIQPLLAFHSIMSTATELASTGELKTDLKIMIRIKLMKILHRQ